MTKKDFRTRRALFEGRKIDQYRRFDRFRNEFQTRKRGEIKTKVLLILALLALLLGALFLGVSAQDVHGHHPERPRFHNADQILK